MREYIEALIYLTTFSVNIEKKYRINRKKAIGKSVTSRNATCKVRNIANTTSLVGTGLNSIPPLSTTPAPVGNQSSLHSLADKFILFQTSSLIGDGRTVPKVVECVNY